jgi:hypothetical protein
MLRLASLSLTTANISGFVLWHHAADVICNSVFRNIFGRACGDIAT